MIRFIYFQFTELKVFERVNTCTLSFFFFGGLQGFRQDLGFQKLGGTIKKTPQKIIKPTSSKLFYTNDFIERILRSRGAEVGEKREREEINTRLSNYTHEFILQLQKGPILTVCIIS